MKYRYEKTEFKFEVGQVVTNNNGYNYKVVEIESQESVTFERVKDGERVRTFKPAMFNKIYENGDIELVLEWASGQYVY